MPELGLDEVQVWQATLDEPARPLDILAASLSEDERRRAERFHFERDRRRFVACRGILRAILAPHARVAAGGVRFRYGRAGKPALATPSACGVRFNVTHSGGIALYALARGREVGVDVERIRPVEGADRIAQRFFSVPERTALRDVAPADKMNAFFTCWTRKEAYVKARGHGLSHPLEGFAVTVTPGAPARLWSAGEDEREIARWSLEALAPPEGYVAALAVEGGRWHLSREQWPPR